MIQAVPKSEAGATWFSDFGSQVLLFRARWRIFFFFAGALKLTCEGCGGLIGSLRDHVVRHKNPGNPET